MSRSDGHEAPCRTHRRGGCLGLLLWVFATLCACAAASPKRVLILTPYGRDAAPFSSAIASFRSVLGRELGEPLDLYEIPLDLARLSDSEGEGPLVAFLEGRIKSQPVDLVVPVGGTSVQFVARHRERLFPDAPVVAVAADPRLVPPGLLQSKATLVTQAVHLPGMVEDILQLCPETTNIVVVAGASALERFWVAECRREFQAFTNRVGFTWLNELPLEDVVARCAVLPPRSFVLHTLFVVDANGIACEKSEALRRLHQGAQAPLFGYFASELGLGTIGGRLYQDSDLGARAARAAIRILQGADPASIPPQILEAAAPVYDGRELRRWGVSESRLSPGSTVRFREPGFWERYRWPLAGTALFVLLQSALIVGLLVNRSRRRQGEMEASLMAEISSKFVNLPAAEIDREIQDAERRICALLGLDLAGLWQWADEAGGTFTLTHLYRVEDGPQPPEPMTARDHFPWCEQQMLAGRTIAVSRMEELPPEAARDREVYRHFGIKSVVAVPLSVGGRSPVGILGFCTTRAEREWPDALVKRLQLVAQIFANALARKRADQTLRDSEFRLNLAVDSAEAGLWALEVGTQTFWASEKARLIFGYAPHEVISMERFQASVHPEDWTRVQQSIAAALQAGAPVNMEYRIRLGDGCEQWITSRGRPVFQSTGEPERLLGLSLDVTERKRTEEALRTSEARLVAGTELAGLGYYEVDYGQGTCFLDDRFRDICGIPPDLREGLGPLEFWRDHVHPDDRQLIQNERQKLQRGEVDRISAEYRYLHSERGRRWLQHSARCAGRSAGGAGIRTFGVIRDISDYRHIVEEQAEDARFGTLITSISSSFVNLPSSEVDLAIEDAQRRICEFIGLDLSALWQPVEETPADYRLTHHYRYSGGPPIERMSAEENFPWCRQQLLGGHVIVVSSMDRLPPEAARDQEVWRQFGVKTSLTLPLSIGGGPALGFLSFNDLRQEREWPEVLVKRLELVAQIFANALARKHADQTLRESEARLRDLSRRLIRAHEEERARLARELHDDVTQRLARLAIDVGRLEGGAEDTGPGETMRSVREGLVRLSEDIHALSYRLHPAVLEDLGLAEALKAECERFARQQSVAAHLKLQDLPADIPLEPSLCLFRVTQEALRNVARHAAAHRVEVSVRPQDGGLQLAVMDDGCGFEPAVQRNHPSLGLASMRERVLLVGGELDIESAPGQGTTVIAWVPIAKAEC